MRTGTAPPATMRLRISIGFLILAALAAFYVLSSGPALRWIVEMPMGRMRYTAIDCYLPVWRWSFSSRETAIGQVYYRYLEWWNESGYYSADITMFMYGQEHQCGPQPAGPKNVWEIHISPAP